MSLFDKLRAWLGAKAFGEPERELERATDDEDEEATRPVPSSASPGTHEVRPKRNADMGAATGRRRTLRKRTTREDDARIEAGTRARFERGEPERALSYLRRRAILFARHEAASSLPCLCQRCLTPDASNVEVEREGVFFVRDFVVARHRALFFWMPAELLVDSRQLRASMRSALRAQVRALSSQRRALRERARAAASSAASSSGAANGRGATAGKKPVS